MPICENIPGETMNVVDYGVFILQEEAASLWAYDTPEGRIDLQRNAKNIEEVAHRLLHLVERLSERRAA